MSSTTEQQKYRKAEPSALACQLGLCFSVEIFGGHTQIATPARCFGVRICTAISVFANLGRGSMFSAAGIHFRVYPG